MWGRRYRERSSNFLSTLLVILLIIAVIFIFAAVISWYILIGFLAVGALIGLYYASRSYIRGLKFAKRSLSLYADSRSNKLLVLMGKLKFFNAETAKRSFYENKLVMQQAYNKSKAYRILSFKKWMWLVVALSNMIFGCAIIAIFVVLQFIIGGFIIIISPIFIAIAQIFKSKPRA